MYSLVGYLLSTITTDGNVPNHFTAWQEILRNDLFGKLEIDMTLTLKEVLQKKNIIHSYECIIRHTFHSLFPSTQT
jgi:hypothetical protein